MIIEHIIIGDKLILLFDFSLEIGSFKRKNSTVKKTIADYIKAKNIDVDGKKILLMVGGVILASFTYLNNEINLSWLDTNYTYTSFFSNINNVPITEEFSNNPSEKEFNEITSDITTSNKSKNNSKTNASEKNNATSSNNKNSTTNKIDKKTQIITDTNAVTVYRQSGSVLTLGLEEYVIGVIAAEMPASFHLEALKSQAILSRTYALKAKETGKKLTDTVSTQAFIDTMQMKSKWGSDYSKYYNKIKQAVEATKGMYISYDGSIIDAVYHSTSNGYTEDPLEVWGYSIPYLKSVESPWDKNTTSYSKTKEFKIDELLNLLGLDAFENIEIVKRNASRRVSLVKVNDNTYSGVDFRNLLSLRSADFDFDLEVSDETLKVTTRGYGHGVGMSQYGANEMAKEGYTYSQIIKHYYSGVKINKL